jgi:hypothetical protein
MSFCSAVQCAACRKNLKNWPEFSREIPPGVVDDVQVLLCGFCPVDILNFVI